MKLYAVRDNKADYFLPMFESPTDGTARRTVAEVMLTQQSFVVHRADYHLFCIGEWDNQTGRLTPLAVPEPVISFEELYEQYSALTHQESWLNPESEPLDSAPDKPNVNGADAAPSTE